MKTLLSTAIIFCGFLTAINSAFAQAWTQSSAPTKVSFSIAVSADGNTQAAIDGSSLAAIWVSTNTGINWTSNSIPSVPPDGLRFVAMSAGGDKMAAVAFFGSAIYTSTNYGTTWASNSVPAEPWLRIASSADGTKLVALGGGIFASGPIYVSADWGQTWAQANAPVTNWVSIASSANGSNWVAAVELQPSGPQDPAGYIYTSTNGGLDWTLMTGAPNLQWASVASSADGTKLVAAGSEQLNGGLVGLIYTSVNSGVTWVSNSLPYGEWSQVASSADGRTLAAVSPLGLHGENTGYIHTSTDSGMIWISNSVPSQSWSSIASSADGGTLLAAGKTSFISSSGSIYISQTVPVPELNISPANTNLTLSWIIPSTNFVAQENLDLNTSNWITLTNAPTLNLNNLNNELSISPTNNIGFFRLILQ